MAGITLLDSTAASIPTPTANKFTFFFDSGVLKYKNSAGAVFVAGDVTDGDKGDIVVSGGGGTWTIDLGVVHAWTKNQSVATVVLTDGTSISVDAALSNNFTVTLGGNRTLDNPTNLTSGMVLNFYIKQDATGSRTLAFGSKYKFAGGVSTISTAANTKDLISCLYDSTDDVLLCNLVKAFA